MRNRLALIFLSVCLACSPTLGQPEMDEVLPLPAKRGATESYSVLQHITLTNEGGLPPGKQNLWVALIRDVPPYQKVFSREIAPANYVITTDEHGNQYAEFDLSDHPAGSTISIDLEYRVTVTELTYDLSTCQGELPQVFTKPELHIESANPQIISLAEDLSHGKINTCEQVRAFYEYAGDTLIYTYNRKAWGAQATFGLMGADCTEYASLVMALSRAEMIPARYYEGLLLLKESDVEAEIAQTEHAWLDVFLPPNGWVAMDPTLGRLPMYRDTYFAHHTPDHIIVTTGRNPSTLRGASYWSHLYWPGDITQIRVTNSEWVINPIEP